jgi:hypothetical protein
MAGEKGTETRQKRAGHGEEVVRRFSVDLTRRFGQVLSLQSA